jgi:hypothetical protein
MARRAGKMLGDMRAMEEEDERANPIVGRGATPSMGLSQFRGGRSCGMEGGEAMVGGRRRRMTKAKAMSEAMRMGETLGQHLHGLHGGAYHRDFVHGMVRGSGFFDDVGSFFTKTLPEQFTNKDSFVRGTLLPEASKYSSFVAPALDAFAPGAGTALSTGLKVAEGANQGAKALGYGRRCGGASISHTGRTEGMGKKRRAPAGASDGRRKRAEIVKKVMREKGMKMIEASQYVKAHGLY